MDIGVLAGLGTAICWTFTALAFEYAGKRIGAFALNFLRLIVASLFLGLYGWARRGYFIPVDASLSSWLWLGASGVVGLLLGDLLLFQAFIDIGSRIAMLVYATAPIMTAVLGFLVFGERISLAQVGGMLLTLAGIAIVVLGKKSKDGQDATRTIGPSRWGRGLVLALGATLGQAGGLILGKLGAGSRLGAAALSAMDPFAGTQIRVLAGVAGFAVLSLATGAFKGLARALKDGRAVLSLTVGSFFGPFLGVSLSLLAVQAGNTGVASALMSITPVLIIAPSALLLKEKVTPREVLGALVAVAGVAVLTLV